MSLPLSFQYAIQIKFLKWSHLKWGLSQMHHNTIEQFVCATGVCHDNIESSIPDWTRCRHWEKWRRALIFCCPLSVQFQLQVPNLETQGITSITCSTSSCTITHKKITQPNFIIYEGFSAIPALWLPNQIVSGITCNTWSWSEGWAEDCQIPDQIVLEIIFGNMGGGNNRTEIVLELIR